MNIGLDSMILLLILAIVLLLFIMNKQRYRKSKEELEKIVEERTAALKHKEQEVTDSIRYAHRIQLSIIPTQHHVKTLLPQQFIFYKPKDIVSGDFYWVEKSNDKILFAAVDCTGHGVPGAMMSVIGMNYLNQAVNDKKLSKPSEILQVLDAGVNATLRQSYDPNAVKDGMDLALCSLDYKSLKLEYAGVFNSLCIVRKNIKETYVPKHEREVFYGTDLLEIKPDKLPIGNNPDGITDVFINHGFQLQKNDCVYIYTDGYADQFGGPKGKKFKYNQLKELLISHSHLDIQEQCQILDKTFNQWRGDLEQVDDVLVIGVKI